MHFLRKGPMILLLVAIAILVAFTARPIAKWYHVTLLRKDLQQRAESGESAAQARLGKDYLFGHEGILRNCDKAIPLLTTAAHHHNDQGLLQLGWALQHGICLKEDDERAFQLYMESAALGNATAMKQLGWLYQNGIGAPKDLNLALDWYRKGAEFRSPHAAYNLADFYYKGYGVLKDDCLALKYMKQSADGNDPEGLYSLGRFSEEAVCTNKDEVAACSCFQKARLLGNADAQNAINRLQTSGLCEDPRSLWKIVLVVLLPAYILYLGTMLLLSQFSPRAFCRAFEVSQGVTIKLGSIGIPIGKVLAAPLHPIYQHCKQNDQIT